MLPHRNMLTMAPCNVPALQIVSIPWDVYQRHDTTPASSAKEELEDIDAADYFKALAIRNGIKVSHPVETTSSNAAGLSPAATEFVPQCASSSETLFSAPRPKTPTLPAPQPSPPEATNYEVNENSNLIEMFQEVMNENKQQHSVLQENMKDREESKSAVIKLTAEKAALHGEVEKLTCDMTKLKERNAMLSEEVEVLAEKLIELEDNNDRLKSQVQLLTNKLQESEDNQDSYRSAEASLVSKLMDADAEKESAKTLAATLTDRLHNCTREKQSFESRAAMLADELDKCRLEKESAETLVSSLTEQLCKCMSEKERKKEPTKRSSHSVEIADVSLEKRMDSLDTINTVDDDHSWTIVKRTKGLKKLSNGTYPFDSSDKSGKRPESLVDTTVREKGDRKYLQKVVTPSMSSVGDHANCNVDPYRAADSKQTLSSSTTRKGPGKTSIDFKTEKLNTDGLHDTRSKIDVNSNSLNAVSGMALPVKTHAKPFFTASVKPSQIFADATQTASKETASIPVKVKPSGNSTPQTLTSDSSIDSLLSWLDSVTSPFGASDVPKSTLSNGSEGCSSHPLFAPAVVDNSFPQAIKQRPGQNILPTLETVPPYFPRELKSGTSNTRADHGKLSAISEKSKTKQDFSCFSTLMSQLSEKFPKKPRNELMHLLKLAKVTFGNQGFRKRKIEEIVKRVEEIISPGSVENESAQNCSICREEMKSSQEKLECGHEFHQECVKEWIEKERSCPLCRSHVLTEGDFPSLA